jgi:phosphoglycerol transferase MdoB-like AlkP superfamily enzyme
MIFLLMFTSFRLITLIAFKPANEMWVDTLPSFFLGMRYDLRWIAIVLLPILLVSMKMEWSPFYSSRNKKVWTWYLAIITFFIFFFFAADFGCFSYNATRLNADALVFMEDASISATMIWQTYPVIWMILGLLIAVLLLRRMFRKLHGQVISQTDGKGIPYSRKWFVLSAFLFTALIYGNAGSEPLRWNTAFTMNNNFTSFLALNPLQNFFTTLKFRKAEYSPIKAKAAEPVLASWMPWQLNGTDYRRAVVPPSRPTQPNVVLVLCESFSMYKSSMSGNKLNTTPYFQSLADNGVFFERCFTPHFSTARGLFATVTGIPDVQLARFSTRNPQALDQHTIINDFKDYNKYYFLGGNPSFNNFEGLLKNIDGLNMITEGKFKSKPVNVWGISDRELFMEANKVFAQQDKPFFAIVQTADNHRPFMIPKEDTDFIKKQVPAEQLAKNGFSSVEEYNTFRYADYCIERFIEAAKKEKYFDNTIFVFVGDHGVGGNATAVYPEVWTKERLTDMHVPLLFYAPSLLPAQKRTEAVSQIDVMPSIAAAAGQPYVNSTLGRDVITTRPANHGAFIIQHAAGKIGMVTDEFYFIKNLNFHKEELHFFKPSNYTNVQKDSISRRMSGITSAYYETSRFMLMNNKKK